MEALARSLDSDQEEQQEAQQSQEEEQPPCFFTSITPQGWRGLQLATAIRLLTLQYVRGFDPRGRCVEDLLETLTAAGVVDAEPEGGWGEEGGEAEVEARGERGAEREGKDGQGVSRVVGFAVRSLPRLLQQCCDAVERNQMELIQLHVWKTLAQVCVEIGSGEKADVKVGRL